MTISEITSEFYLKMFCDGQKGCSNCELYSKFCDGNIPYSSEILKTNFQKILIHNRKEKLEKLLSQ